MGVLNWLVLSAYFLGMMGVGVWARSKVKSANDFFTAGGAMPWWLSGISHHMSGYSSAVFVGYAAIAYTSGFSLYIWWAFTIGIALILGCNLFPVRWSRLRQRLGIISPVEYLAIRYNVPTQQLIAWSGAFLKIFDVGAKWTAAAILLQVFAGVSTFWSVLLTGGVTLVYSVVGGLWADALTDMSQFLIQVCAALVMLVAVFSRLGGISSLWTIWSRLPPAHHQPFTGQYTPGFACAFLLINFLSYNGGTWNLAQRFIASPSAKDARKASLLSAGLYLVWPLVLLFPMWAAPLLLPNLTDPSQSYALLTQKLLPPGLVGLVLAGLFAHTMAMTSSDANAVSAVVVRDILPTLRRNRPAFTDRGQLAVGRISTFLFLALSMVIALSADHFGGVIGLIILWYAALVGPIAIPMLLGMLTLFRRSGPIAAILSWTAGAISFCLARFIFADRIAASSGDQTTTVMVAVPIVASLVVYVLAGLIWPSLNPRSDALLEALQRDSLPEEAISAER